MELELNTLRADLVAATSALEALEASLPSPVVAPPPLMVVSFGDTLFVPAFVGDERLLSFASAPQLREVFFSGFEHDNGDLDEDNLTPDDAICEVGEHALSNCDAVFKHVKAVQQRSCASAQSQQTTALLRPQGRAPPRGAPPRPVAKGSALVAPAPVRSSSAFRFS